MKEIIIRNNVNQIITITDEVKELGAKFVLINEKNAPIAWYVFDKEKFQEDMNDRLELEKEIKPISIDNYAEEKLEEKERINKEKIKKELEQDL